MVQFMETSSSGGMIGMIVSLLILDRQRSCQDPLPPFGNFFCGKTGHGQCVQGYQEGYQRGSEKVITDVIKTSP